MAVLSPDSIYLLCASLCASIGALFDVRTRRIPNLVTAASLVVGLLLHLQLAGWKPMGLAAIGGLIAGAIFFLFFVAGGMGAGDVKLMAAVGCIAGTEHLAQILITTALVGGLFAIVVAVLRGRLKSMLANVAVLVLHHAEAGLQPHPTLNVLNAATLRLPYAVAIAGGCWITWVGQALWR